MIMLLVYPLMIGWWEAVIIAFVVLLLFGAKRVPELMKGLGKGVRSFKEGMSGIDDDGKKIESGKSDDLDDKKD